MSETIRIIAERIRDLRDISDFSIDEVVENLSIDKETYIAYETGASDIPVSVLCELAKLYNVELSELLDGDKPHLKTYCLVRKGKGEKADRSKDYKYKNLAPTFSRKKGEPFLVTMEPKPEGEDLNFNHHPGQEFNYLLEGRIRIHIGSHEEVLEQGDSIYFDATCPHTFEPLDNKACKVLVVIM